MDLFCIRFLFLVKINCISFAELRVFCKKSVYWRGARLSQWFRIIDCVGRPRCRLIREYRTVGVHYEKSGKDAGVIC